MSSKVVLATVALAAIVASTDAKVWENIRKKLDLAAIGKKTPAQKALAQKRQQQVKKASLMDEDSEVQKLKLGKIVKGISTGLDLVGKAKGVGLFEEDEKRGPTSWEINGGASNGGKWNIGGKISGSFEEEEVQKLQLDLRKATKALASAEKLGLFEEDAELDEVQKLKLGKVIKGAVKVVKVAGAVGLLEEEDVVELAAPIHKLIKCTFVRNLPLDEETEEDLQKLKLNLKKVVQGVNTGLDLVGKAKSVGLFDEQAIIYNPGRPRSVPMDFASFEETHWDPPSSNHYFDEEAESVLDCTTPPKNCEFNRACAYWALYCKEQHALLEEEQGWNDIRPIPIAPELIRHIKFDEEEGWGDIRPIPIVPELLRPIKFDEEEGWNNVHPILIAPELIRPIKFDEDEIYEIGHGLPRPVKFEEDEIYQINPGLPRVVKFEEEGIIRDNWVPYTNKFERDIAVEKLHRLNKLQHPKK